MIDNLYAQIFNSDVKGKQFPNSLIQNYTLKERLQIVFKGNKAWVFDYENSVLYTLTQMGALFTYALQKGHSYAEIVTAISQFYGLSVYRVDSDFQEFLSDMFKIKFIQLAS